MEVKMKKLILLFIIIIFNTYLISQTTGGAGNANRWIVSGITYTDEWINFKEYLDSNNDNYYDAMVDVIASLPDSNGTLYFPAGNYNLTCPILFDSVLTNVGKFKNLTICGDGQYVSILRIGTNINKTTTTQNFDSDNSTVLHVGDKTQFSVDDGIAFGTGMVGIVNTVYAGDSLNIEIHYMTSSASMHPFVAGTTHAVHSFPAIFISNGVVDGLIIRDLCVIGSKYTGITGIGNELEPLIWLNDISDVIIQNVYCKYGRDDGIVFNNCNEIKIINNKIYDMNDKGIHYSGISKTIQIINNWIKDADLGIFVCLHGDSSQVIGNIIIGGSKSISGIGSGDSHFSVNSNMIIAPTTVGIEITNGSGINAIINNHILGANTTIYGIHITSVISTIFRNNFISQCDTCFWATGARNNIISNNDFIYCTGVGLHLDSSTSYPYDNTITNNSFINCGKYIYAETTGYVDSLNYIMFNRNEDSGTNRLNILRPTTPSTSFNNKGRMWWHNTDNKMYIWDGSSWNALY